MTPNKFRYYQITTTKFVRALNQGDAENIAKGRRNGAPGQVVATQVEAERIPATVAHAAVLEA